VEKKILIVYHSEKQHTMFMAINIQQSLESLGVNVDVKNIERCDPGEMVGYDGVILGSPTYFSNMSWQLKKFIDDSASLRVDGFPLEGRVCGCFTSSGSREDGLSCVNMIEVAFKLHHKMNVVKGIVAESYESEDKIVQICHEYSREIFQQMENS